MPSAKALEKHRAQLESKKQSILAQIELCNRRLETVRIARKAKQILWDSNPESEAEVEAYPVSQERLEEIERLKVQLQATQELCRVDELAVEVKVIERPENVPTLPAEEQEAGTWSEVTARGRVEYVPFHMKFFIYENVYKAVTYHSLSTVATKPLQATELRGSALHACRSPSEALHGLVQYSKAYKERRDTLLAITDRYSDKQICIETTDCGGYRLLCTDVLEVEWRVTDGATFLHPFRHRFLMSCDDDASLVEKYLSILQRLYKKLKDPKNDAEERKRWLCKIIELCLKIYMNDVVQSTELDAETVAQITNGRKTSPDRNTEVMEPFRGAERMVPVKQSAQNNNENRPRQDKKGASETTNKKGDDNNEAKRKRSKKPSYGMDKVLHNGEISGRGKHGKSIVNKRTDDIIQYTGENEITQKPDKITSNRMGKILHIGEIAARENTTKIVNERTCDMMQVYGENELRQKSQKTTSNRKIDEMLQVGKKKDHEKLPKKTINGRTDVIIQDNVENEIRQKQEKTKNTSNKKINEMLQDGKNEERKKQAKKTVNGRTDDIIQDNVENEIKRKPEKITSNTKIDERTNDIEDKCESEERRNRAMNTLNGKLNDARIKENREKLPKNKVKENNTQTIQEKDGGFKGQSQNNAKHTKVDENEIRDLQEKRYEHVEKKIKNCKKKNADREDNIAKGVKSIQYDQRGNHDKKNNSDKENQQMEARKDIAKKNKEKKNSEFAQKNTKNKEGIKALNYVQKNKIKNKQKANVINKVSNVNIEQSNGNAARDKNNKKETKTIECPNPLNMDIPLSPIIKVGPSSDVPKIAQIKNRLPIGMDVQEDYENQQKTDLNMKDKKNSKRPKTTNNTMPEKRSKSSQNPRDTDRTKVPNNDVVSMLNLNKNRTTMGESAQSAKVREKSAKKSDAIVDSARSAKIGVVSNIVEKVATSARDMQKLDMAHKVNKKKDSAQNVKRVTLAPSAKERVDSAHNVEGRVNTAQNAKERVDSAQNAKERVNSAQNVKERVDSAQNADGRVNLAQNGKQRVDLAQNSDKRAISAQKRISLANEKDRNLVHNTEKINPVKRATLTAEKSKSSNSAPTINRDKPKNALNILGKRKISPEVPGTKIPRLMPSFRANLARPATPRRSPRKLLGGNREKAFFSTRK